MGKSEIRFNVFFWLTYFLYEWLGNASVGNEYSRYLINALVMVPLTFTAAMFTVHFLLKKYFLKGRKQRFWLLFIGSAILFCLIRRTFNYYYTYPNYYPQGLIDMPYLYWPKLLIEAVNTYLIVGLYAMFYFVRELYKQQRISHELEQDKVETELQLLKSQVQPHFMFNTLNNIYSLSEHGNPKTSDLIYRLSAFLSYSLYDSRQDTITVQQELDYIQHYIELERIRYGDELDVSINVFHSVEGFRISPMLFLPLVENAFKHGLGDSKERCWIRLDLTVQEDWLTLKIENSLPEDYVERESRHSGIGLKNVKKRLDILYPGKHQLQCMKEEDSFLTILKIKYTAHGN
jgi:sensor histidine kinase YesM